MHKTYPVTQFKALEGEGDAEGTFEAVVAVFGNVDLVGDRIVKGAFKSSLAEWDASGDPIPVVWSHQWDNLDAHVGYVVAAAEKDAGLWIRGQLDLDEDFAARLWKKMKRRSIREFSFAYDVVEEARADDGANELLELRLLEVGPTLKGANPATQLLDVKRDGRVDDLPESVRKRVAQFARELDEMGDQPHVEPPAAAAAGEDTESRVKAGRTISSKNATMLREARDRLDAVLNQINDDPPQEEEQDESKSAEQDEAKSDAKDAAEEPEQAKATQSEEQKTRSASDAMALIAAL